MIATSTEAALQDQILNDIAGPDPAAHELVERCGRPEGVSLDELPMLPRVATEILLLARDPDADLARMAALLHHDMVLAGHVLRIANSPAYLPRTPIVSLQQAITRLGLSTLTEISLAASLQSGVFKTPGREELLVQLWRDAVATAAWAREIARQLRNNAESAFLGGLLHAIGKPVVLIRIASFENEFTPRPDDATVAIALDGLYVDWGLALARHWGLPEEVNCAIEHHLEPVPDDPSLLPAIVGLARHLVRDSHNVEADSALDADAAGNAPAFSRNLAGDPQGSLLASLNLYPEDLEAILGHREAVQLQVSALLL